MKLLPEKKRKVCVVFAGGLGDTLIYVPLLRTLKKKKFHITCLLYSKDDNDFLFDTGLFDKKVRVKSKKSLLFFAIRNFRCFSNFYVNHLANGALVNQAGRICSSKVTRTDVHGEQRTKRDRQVIHEFSDAEQNLHLLFSPDNAKIRDIRQFYFSATPTLKSVTLANNIRKYLILQVSAGNNRTPYKNWPIENWLLLVEKLCNGFPETHFIILGDKSEAGYKIHFEKLERPNCRVLIGNTTVSELFDLVGGSTGYIGLDSGIMHIAVVCRKKTLTIFGASDEKLYGYAHLKPADHKIISLPVYCRPCSAWKDANTSRVTDPMQCPDFACLAGISVEVVYAAAVAHFNLE